MHQPVDLWEGGETNGQVDAAEAAEQGYIVVDLGEEWTPYLFSTRGNASEPEVPNTYRATYLALARGELPRDHHGERARRDKYLELYGIMPTLGLLRERMRHVSGLACAASLDLEPLADFDGFVSYQSNDGARRDSRNFAVLTNQIERLLDAQHVESVDALNLEALDDRDVRRVRDYREQAPKVAAIRAAQERLACEGFFADRGSYTRGAIDWVTHEALAEFERRHRVYGWGFIGKDTLDALRKTPMENEREAVIRVLAERAMHAAGVIEDGSTSTKHDGTPRTFRGADGAEHTIPNLEAQIRESIVSAFGLETPESTLAWLDSLGELPPDGERLVAVHRPELPEYYSGDMDLFVEIDRGDVWYDFPFDAEGRELGQPVQRRPRLTIFTNYRGQKIPLARFGTTIGGWRSEVIDGTVMWKYKNSPPGDRIWHQIVAAPVWLPPESTPPKDLLARNPRGRGADRFVVNYHETGPSYASAYGLVAAYHLKYLERDDGTLRHGNDEGIRTHGSVDYMSIMRRHSHGCHRLHNHIAVRLMSFVLAHRPHRRVGQQRLSWRRVLEHEGETYNMEIDEGGYVFDLEEPVRVAVLEGRIRGQVQRPIEGGLPKFNPDLGGYVLPDGGAVTVGRDGRMTPTELPVMTPDGGVPVEQMSDQELLEALPIPSF
jgi:hypothetical protein